MTEQECAQCTATAKAKLAAQDAWIKLDNDNPDSPEADEAYNHFRRGFPSSWWDCDTCGAHLEAWMGGDVSCDCGAQYNGSGQRLRDDWRGNPAWSDDDMDDMEGFERQQLAAEGNS